MIQEIPLHQEVFVDDNRSRKNRKIDNVRKLKTLMKMKFSKGKPQIESCFRFWNRDQVLTVMTEFIRNFLKVAKDEISFH